MTARTATTLTSLLLASLLAPGCNGIETSPDVCSAASAHLRSCFGSKLPAATFVGDSCNEATAEKMLGMSCQGLSLALLGGKADYGVEEQVKEAIKDAIRQAIAEGLKQVIEQILGSFGSSLEKYDFYLLLYQSDDEAEAQAKAQELDQVMGDDPEMEPRVIKLSDGYGVIHGPCPLELSTTLAKKVASLVADNPELIKALGGSMSSGPDEDGLSSEINISLPLALLPMKKSQSAKLGCGQ